MPLFLLSELVILLAASILIIFISHRIKLPSVVGFLLTGILIGPGGLSLVKDTETIDVLAEIGVVMLLFMIGLEFTLDRLKRIQQNFRLGAGSTSCSSRPRRGRGVRLARMKLDFVIGLIIYFPSLRVA